MGLRQTPQPVGRRVWWRKGGKPEPIGKREGCEGDAEAKRGLGGAGSGGVARLLVNEAPAAVGAKVFRLSGVRLW